MSWKGRIVVWFGWPKPTRLLVIVDGVKRYDGPMRADIPH